MPLREYQCPEFADWLQRHEPSAAAFTSYAIPYGEHGIFNGGEPLKFEQIFDGTSNTILAVEASGQRIIWSEPRDVPFDATPLGINLPGSQPGRSDGVASSFHPGVAFVVFADGHIRGLGAKIAPEVLKQLLQADDGVPAEF